MIKFTYSIFCSRRVKRSFSNTYKYMKPSWKLVAIVHDEIVLEVNEEEVIEAKEVLETSMKLGMKKIIKDIPIVVDSSISNNWCK